MKLTRIFLILLLGFSGSVHSAELVKTITEIPMPMAGKSWKQEKNFCINDQTQKMAHQDPVGTFIKHIRKGYKNPDDKSMVTSCEEKKADWNSDKGHLILLCKGNAQMGMQIHEVLIDATVVKTQEGIRVATKMNSPDNKNLMMEISSNYILTGQNCTP